MKISYSLNQYSQQRQTQKPVWIYPVLLAMQAEYYRQQGHDVYWDSFCADPDKVITTPENINFLKLPMPDRVFTNAFDKKYQRYGNYKYHPATHMQVADGCWWGKCAFCVENKKEYKIRQMNNVIEEIARCYLLGFKEVFDDSGTFPTGNWLKNFCNYKNAVVPQIVLGCNMRICDVDFDLMKKANFRMILFGVESFNQNTLNTINKGVNVETIIPTLKRAVEAGLEPHITVMFGCPGQSEEEEDETIRKVHYLLRTGYAKTAQASIYKVPGMPQNDTGRVNRIYNVAHYPDFWINKFRDIKSWDDFCYLLKSIKKGIIRD